MPRALRPDADPIGVSSELRAIADVYAADDAKEKLMRIKKGDRVIVESEKVGVEPRSGVVKAVNGPAVQVQWDDGHETTFVPAAGAMSVEEPGPEASTASPMP